MPTDDVVILIDAKDEATAKLHRVQSESRMMQQNIAKANAIAAKESLAIALQQQKAFTSTAFDGAGKSIDKVAEKTGGLRKSLFSLTTTLSHLGVFRIPGLEFIAHDLNAAKHATEKYAHAQKEGLATAGAYRLGIYAIVAVAGYKLIEWLVDAKAAQEKLNEAMKEGVEQANNLAKAQLDQVNKQMQRANLIKDAENRREEMERIRDELRMKADAANKEVEIASRRAKKFKEFHEQNRAAEKLLGWALPTVRGEGDVTAMLEEARAAATPLNAELNKLNDELERMALQKRTDDANEYAASLQAIADNATSLEKALEEQVATFGMSNRELFLHKLMLENVGEASRKYQMALFDTLEAKKREEEHNKSMRDERKQIRKDLDESKKRGEEDIARLRERIAEEKDKQMESFYKSAANLQATESRTLTRGSGAHPAERTATATEKMLEEIRKLQAKAEANAKAAEKRLDEIKRGVWTKPTEKVIDG